ncbi:hypothetical protein BAUCODRAFT_126167 [Baudoinia panamericana UAMH 10762]|uniref:Uncharacterized protein n=1 Tax=Baudoinia panamericana (strain UAMH 10762) TaxID=717646 RepID=M2N0L1_BAUPA|nr:uncharacterized protein BAUCODRAFT_126167 [Baudoinia panamericana UAMH 10762]EMC92160.1 hypothetical protein BAUCODRAFT_126167 [Baudoinia panamericana UAMH 10762]
MNCVASTNVVFSSSVHQLSAKPSFQLVKMLSTTETGVVAPTLHYIVRLPTTWL